MGPKRQPDLMSTDQMKNQATVLLAKIDRLLSKISTSDLSSSSLRAMVKGIQNEVDTVLGERTDHLLDAITSSIDFADLSTYHTKVSEGRLNLSIAFQEMCDKITPTEYLSKPGGTESDPQVKQLQLFQFLISSVPTFNGDILKFAEFKASFERAVHGLDIPPHVKMSALKKLVSGSAGACLERYGTSPEDYDDAYKELIDRYSSPRRVADAVLKAFNVVPPCFNNPKPGDLERFRNEISATYHALVNLKIQRLAEFIMFSSIKNRIPASIQDRLYDEIGEAEIPDVQAILSFLDNELARLRSRDVPSRIQITEGSRRPTRYQTDQIWKQNKPHLSFGNASNQNNYVQQTPVQQVESSQQPPTDNEAVTSTPQANNEPNYIPKVAEFPILKLTVLDEKISSRSWVVPVFPDQELEHLMQAAINLSKTGDDVSSESCQRFFREGLTISFTKILTDEAVNSWNHNVHQCIYQNCLKLAELCVLKLNDDLFLLLDLLAMVFNPNNRFHTFNAARLSETVLGGSRIPEEEIYARPPDIRTPRGWLVDLINRFGTLGGFQILVDRFAPGKNVPVPVIHALIRPFGSCYELLTVHTIEKFLVPIVERVPQFLDNLTDDEVKNEAKNESKNDAISSIIKSAKCLLSRVTGQEETVKQLEIFRLKMILRLLQISSFNGKMNALNEVNRVITGVSYYPHHHTTTNKDPEGEWLTPDRMAKWIKENGVLQIVLRDSLHQPQYVEELEKILRFVIKERCLSLEDLDSLWAAQHGKHEAIVENVHDLLATLGRHFSPEQLDHLVECFQSSWTSANKKQREKLLELIRRLAKGDQDGVMAHKVLTSFWNLAHSDDVVTEIMDQTLSAQVKILNYSFSQERDAQKMVWLNRCVDELNKNENWVLPALKQIREIACLYRQPPNANQRGHHLCYRQEVITRLQTDHKLVIVITNNLTDYIDKTREVFTENPQLDPNEYYPDKRYNHVAQVQERLNFLRFLLKDGQLWLCADQAKQIWTCLAEGAVFPSDREACFKWFSKLMGDEPTTINLDPDINKDFFISNVLQLDPSLLTESGMKCFERFFKAVNSKEGKLKTKERTILIDDVDLIGNEYIWRVIISGSVDMAARAIQLLKEVTTNLGPRLQNTTVGFHRNYISECLDRLIAHYDTVSALRDSGPSDFLSVKQECVKMCRVLKVLKEYISEYDGKFTGDRNQLPL